MSLPMPERAASDSQKSVRMAKTYSPPITIAPNSENSPRSTSVASSCWLYMHPPAYIPTVAPGAGSQAREGR